jgi:PAS domain S-box-containing protein
MPNQIHATTESVHVLASPLESASILRSIVEIIRSIMQADVASIFGFELDDETVGWKAAAGFRSSDIDYEATLRKPDSINLALQALAENRVIVFEGAGSTSNLPLYVAEGVEYLAVAPIRISGNRSGVVTAGFRQLHQFSQDEKELLQDLAEMASLTLDNARLQEVVGEKETTWRLAQLFARIGTFEWDIQHGIDTWSPAMQELYGLSGGESQSQMVWVDFVHPDDRASVISAVLEAFESCQPVDAQWRVTWADGSIRWLLGRFQLFEDEKGHPIRLTGINLDITERKLAEDAAREMREQLARSHRLAAIGQLAAGVAHEVNNPLATITTCAEGMIRDMRDPESKTFAASKRWDVYAEEIVKQAMRCKQITRGLLDLTHQREPKLVSCDINALVSDCVRVAAMRKDSQIEFQSELNESIGRITTDPDMVRQVVDNLLSNALDAIAEGESQGAVKAATRAERDRIIIEIADTGKGVPPDLLARIFDPFFTTKRTGKGYGLGLSISLSLAESLGGGLSVESDAGQGSKFRLWLPSGGRVAQPASSTQPFEN